MWVSSMIVNLSNDNDFLLDLQKEDYSIICI